MSSPALEWKVADLNAIQGLSASAIRTQIKVPPALSDSAPHPQIICLLTRSQIYPSGSKWEKSAFSILQTVIKEKFITCSNISKNI